MRDDYPSALGRWERLFLQQRVIGAASSAIVLVILGIFLLLGGSSSDQTNTGGGTGRTEENGLEAARQSLARQTDLNTCRGALQQINSELGEKVERRAPPLTAEQADWLRQHASLDPGELAEIESGNYTQLDGHHLDRCFLLRDVARTLEVKSAPAAGAAVRETGLDRAAAAFAWVVRQVQLREHAGEAVPAVFALRRGWGTALERALVFLALLEQTGSLAAPRPELLGCLLFVPGKEADRLNFWACGVAVGDGKDLYLFDPRLGLPLPGPKRQGIATLAEVRKQPEVLAQLNEDEKMRYDVTPEQARAAHALIACPLSALSPRMRHLQENLLPPVVRVRLAADPVRDMERLTAACAGGTDKPTPVKMLKSAVVLSRRFLPPDEGGVDEGEPMRLADLRGFTLPDDDTIVRLPRRQRFLFELVPWTAMPPQFQDNNRFPYNIGLGQKVRDTFASPFISSAMDAGGARDLQLRGRFSKAAPELVQERDRWHAQRQRRANAADVEQRAAEWLQRAIADYAAQLRARSPQERADADARVKDLWRNSEAVTTLLLSALAEARSAEVSYLLGLCMQEQAEQLQARLDRQAGGPDAKPHTADVEKARQAWQNARSTWKLYGENYPTRGDRAAARRMRGRAEALLGDWRAAVASWEDLSGAMTDLEKLASRYQARQLKKQHEKK